MVRHLLVTFIFLFLAGCATTTPQNAAVWPQDLPPYSYYVEQYDSDPVNQEEQSFDSYLRWVKNFFNGTDFYANGWMSTSQEALSYIEDETERELLAEKLAWLGKRISAEWAKSNKVRLITSRHVSIWGVSLEEALAQGKVLLYADSVQRDIDAILAGRIEPKDITNYRYFAETDDFFF